VAVTPDDFARNPHNPLAYGGPTMTNKDDLLHLVDELDEDPVGE
jgi:hypothetical protein